MVDRIDIGVAPRIAYDEPTSTSGFSYTGQETLSADQYGSQFVDFYSQSLDIPSLSEQTGIDPGTAPEVGEDIQLKGMTQDSSDGREDSEANVVADLERALSGGQSSFGDIKFGEDAFAKGGTYASYGEYQKKEGTADRVSLVQGMYEPLVEGNLSGLNFEALGKQAEQKVTGLPGQAATQVQETAGIFTGGYDKFKERASEKAEGAFKGAMSMVGGLPGALLGGALFGGNSRNAFGNMTASGSGAFKVVSDLLHSRQYADVEANRAAAAANKAAGDAFGPRGPEGFQMVFGNGMGITRRVGTGAYTGNMQGLSHSQVKTMEALQKGFVPSGYNMVNETGRTLESEGYNSGRLSTGGYYKDNGTYMTPTGVTARFGMEKDAKALGDKYGISDLNKVKSILQDARNGKGTVSGLMNKAQADAAKQVADQRRADEDRAAAEKAKQDAIFQARVNAFNQSRSGESEGSDDGPRTDSGGRGFGAGAEDTGSYDEAGLASGGRIGMAAGGQMASGMAPSGFIGAPPSQVSEAESVADNVNTQKEEGTFIINAAAVEFAGESDVMKMLKDAQKEAVRRGITVDNPERSAKLIDVALSQGEVTVAPHLVKIIGEDRLTKINNRGKPEVKERIEENGQQMAAQGGFLESPQAYALGDKVKVYRGEPLDLEKVNPTDYGYGSDDVGKFHTPDKNRARQFAAGGGRGNQVIRSRKVTMDQLFDGVEEAWKVQGKKKTDYFAKMPKKELDKNLKFIKSLRAAYASGERSVDSMVMFLQEQVFDGKSKIDFIETFKNDPLSGGKLLGRAIRKVATKAAPPIAILERAFNATPVADATLGDSFLNSSATPDFTKNKN